MGFKKGWKAYKAQQRKTKSKRKSSPKPKSKGSTRRSTRSSNPGGGVRTEKLGGLFKRIKSAFNLTAAAQGAAVYPGMDFEDKLELALARHTGIYEPGGVGGLDFNVDRCLETYKGIATEIVVQYFDSKTRHFGNISKGKLLDIAEELLPIAQAHEDAKRAPDYLTQAARNYHKYTQGYDMQDYPWGSWNFERMKPYATIKIVRAVGNKTGFIPFINKHLPKGLNL